MTFEETVEEIRKVAKLEGWDESPLDTRLQQYQTGDSFVREGLTLFLQKPAASAVEYNRIRSKRPEVFWENCKATNDTLMREYVDIRQLAKLIRSEVFHQPKGPKKSG